MWWDFPGGWDYSLPAMQGDLGFIPGWGRSPEEGNGNPLQYSCLENFMDRGAWWATVHEVTKNQTWLSDWHYHILLNVVINIYGSQLTSYLIVNNWMLSPKIRNKTRISAFAISIQHCTGGSSYSIWARKWNIRHSD